MIWSPLHITRFAFRSMRPRAVRAAQIWSKAARQEPSMAQDVLRMGGVLWGSMPVGRDNPAADATHRLAYEAGRRDLALEIAALMNLKTDDILTLMETNYDLSGQSDDDVSHDRPAARRR